MGWEASMDRIEQSFLVAAFAGFCIFVGAMTWLIAG
jgi:hypothetical protein